MVIGSDSATNEEPQPIFRSRRLVGCRDSGFVEETIVDREVCFRSIRDGVALPLLFYRRLIGEGRILDEIPDRAGERVDIGRGAPQGGCRSSSGGMRLKMQGIPVPIASREAMERPSHRLGIK